MAAEQPLSTEKWWDDGAVAVITGANKGIGFEMARLMGKEGAHVVVTSRDEGRGKEALKRLQEAEPSAKFEYCQADITDSKSIQDCAKWLKEKHGHVTWLMNNAGIAYKGNAFSADEAQITINCNLKGTREFTEAVLPLMKSGDRIVNTCSMAGKLSQLKSDVLKKSFLDPKDADDIEQLADGFVEGIRNGDYQQKGYGMSKLAETSYTLWLARHLESQGIMVNAICPGYVNTDMTSGKGVKTLREGADTPVWVALRAPKDASTGVFYQERKEFNWHGN